MFDFACRDAAATHKNFLSGRARFPRWAKKGRTRERFTIIGRVVALEAGWLTLPKIGRVRIAGACPAQAKLRRLIRRGRARITSVTNARYADGTWWASCKVEQQLRTPRDRPHANDGTPVVGVDRGLKTAAVVATAHRDLVDELPAGRYPRATARRLAHAHAQRTVARRTVRGRSSSKNREKAIARVDRLHVKAAAQRADALHTFTRRVAAEHPVIVVETLATKNLMANRHLAGDRRPGVGGDGPPAHLQDRVARRHGAARATVLPVIETSSACGAVKPKLSLSERTYTCDVCGLVADRDVNAAAVLAAWGEHQYGSCPCAGGTATRVAGTQVRDRHPRRPVRQDSPSCLPRVGVRSAPAAVPVLPGEAGTSQPHPAAA